MFMMVQGVVQVGVFHRVARDLAEVFGPDLFAASLFLLGEFALTSSVLPNTPAVVAMVLLVKGCLVIIEAVPEADLGETFLREWPDPVFPVFSALMLGATLGGNATAIGASANIVAAGIASKAGSSQSFVRFARYGVPITLAQIAVGALYVIVLDYSLRA